MAALWRIREDGAGLAARSLDRPAQAAGRTPRCRPSGSGAYLRGFDALLKESGLDGVPYGHFGDGCVHVRIDFPLRERDGAARFRAFVEAAAGLTAGHGGSMSGEHGDGRARSALLSRMYSAEVLDAVRRRQAPVRPRRPAQPRGAGATRDPSRPTSG